MATVTATRKLRPTRDHDHLRGAEAPRRPDPRHLDRTRPGACPERGNTMRHDPVAVRLARLQVELLRDERALVAEGQRLVLHRGRELADLCSRSAGQAGEHEAEAFRDEVLWSERPPDEWPLGAMITLLRDMTDLSARDRMPRDDVLGGLLRLARSADDLHGLRARIVEMTAERHRLVG